MENFSSKPTFGKKPPPASQRLHEHLKKKPRDDAWCKALDPLLMECSYLFTIENLNSSDAHKYIGMERAAPGDSNAVSLRDMAIRAVAEGKGLSLYTKGQEYSDLLLPVGVLVPLAQTGKLPRLDQAIERPEIEFSVDEFTPYTSENPGEDILPAPVRAAMREWLAHWFRIDDAYIYLRRDGAGKTRLSVPFSSEIYFDRGSADHDLALRILYGLYWFLPPDVVPTVLAPTTLDDFFPL